MLLTTDVWQLIGATFVLSAYVLAQAGRLDSDTYRYLGLNFAGAAILAVLAVDARLWGFVLLEFVWALASAVGLVRKLARPQRRRLADK